MLKPLLIEIGTEELPALPLLKNLAQIEKKWLEVLEKYNFKTGFELFYTPRRLVLWHREFPLKQPDIVEEFWGAPKKIAEKNPKAVVGFARKIGISPDQLTFKFRAGQGESLYFSRKVEGKPIQLLLGQMVEEWLTSLNFGKSMRWGKCSYSFIRPIRSILALLEEELIPFKTFCTKTTSTTFIHPTLKKIVAVVDVKDYFQKLKKGGILLYPEERERRILEGIAQLQREKEIEIEVDQKLLREIVAITEYPVPLLGKFDSKFLTLPPEVIVTSMKEHQRYFPVYKNGKLFNRFVLIANSFTDNFSAIIAGNQRVLRARLEDALFFWEQDLKRGLKVEGLKKVVYMDRLGSIADKVERELEIARLIGKLASVNSKLMEQVLKALQLAKGDLLTDMVYEFPELQGIMGYYYSKAMGVSESIAIAIREQYRDRVSNPVSAILNLSQKLENLIGLFGVGERPKGNRDPYGMRRSANHILKILKEYSRWDGLTLREIDLNRLIIQLAEIYRQKWDIKVKPEEVIQFLSERLYHWYRHINPAIVRAVIAGGEGRIPYLDKKITLLAQLSEGKGWEELVSLFKRVANILKGVDWEQLEVRPELFIQSEERELWEKLQEVKKINRQKTDLEQQLDQLLDLSPTIAQFFDKVRVNVEAGEVRKNRQGLVGAVLKEFIKVVGDLRYLSS